MALCSGSSRSTAASGAAWLIAVGQDLISQDYTGCREGVPNGLSLRTQLCSVCELVRDRDVCAPSTLLLVGGLVSGTCGIGCRGDLGSP